jgi:two-component system, chemotaxis family, CheB/CheR fusion protein
MNQTDPSFEALLSYLKEARGFDFTVYKRSSLMRRVQVRMAQIAVSEYTEYLDYLQVHPDEFTALFNTILINVTGFFRDPQAWESLRTQALGQVVEDGGADAPIRVWSAGCASGAEAYTLAMLLAELMGIEAYQRRVKIYATDVDEDELGRARQAVYGEREISDVPLELLGRYFEARGGQYAFRKDVRRTVIFGRNDLVRDAPISRIDLLICRNTLMYFNGETQSRILERFHFALAPAGILFLGKAEMLQSHTGLFRPIDLKYRLFQKVVKVLRGNATLASSAVSAYQESGGLDQLRDEAFVASPVAQIVVTSDGLVALTNQQAESMFGVSSRDVGRPFRDLEVSYRPAELRRPIEQAQVERRPVQLPGVEFVHPGGGTRHLEVQVNPIITTSAALLGVTLVFHDVTESRQLRDELEHANRQLADAYRELQSTNEELETTNEELQSTVEELETTNEELQSTNEELETTNEELQSTNDQLQHINDQLRGSSIELDHVNGFLEAVLASLQIGVAVVGPDLEVRVWNQRAQDLWGIRSEEAVGQHFYNLDIGLPTERLRPALRQALLDSTGPVEVPLTAVNRRGRSIDLRVICAPIESKNAMVPTGVVVVMEVVTAGVPAGS